METVTDVIGHIARYVSASLVELIVSSYNSFILFSQVFMLQRLGQKPLTLPEQPTVGGYDWRLDQ